MSNRIDAVLVEATSRLRDSDTPRLDAEVLLASVLNKPRCYFFTWPEKQLSTEELTRFEAALQQRLEGHPIAYITGQRFFWNLDLQVNTATLIPRPDTELLVELALTVGQQLAAQLPDAVTLQVADLGTGSGAIALALAMEQPRWAVMALDQSADALALAQQNAMAHELHQVRFLQSSWCDDIPAQSLHLIVSNPPYVRSDDPHLSQGDVRFEPLSALTSGIDGLDDIRTIATQAADRLLLQGWLLVEHGYDQGEEVRAIFTAAGFNEVRTEQDLAGLDRVTLGRWSN